MKELPQLQIQREESQKDLPTEGGLDVVTS